MAVFRAVENRRWLLRAANTGISAFVDPQGRIVARTQLFEKRALLADAAFISGITPYARLGDVFAWSCLGLSLLGLLIAARMK
jgi:apolipoprotein N-acyltransferase